MRKSRYLSSFYVGISLPETRGISESFLFIQSSSRVIKDQAIEPHGPCKQKIAANTAPQYQE